MPSMHASGGTDHLTVKPKVIWLVQPVVAVMQLSGGSLKGTFDWSCTVTAPVQRSMHTYMSSASSNVGDAYSSCWRRGITLEQECMCRVKQTEVVRCRCAAVAVTAAQHVTGLSCNSTPFSIQ